MKSTIIIIIIISVLLTSCLPRNEPKIIVKNNTNIKFDSIRVYTSINLPTIFYELKPNQSVKGKILFDKNKKGDGCYKITIHKNGDVSKKECFGYYTNGASLSRKFNIYIEKDTMKAIQIIIKQ